MPLMASFFRNQSAPLSPSAAITYEAALWNEMFVKSTRAISRLVKHVLRGFTMLADWAMLSSF